MGCGEYQVAPLSALLDEYDVGDVASLLDSYRAVFDSSTESFLRGRAVEMEMRDLSRTYLAIDMEYDIIGYVTLSIKCMSIPDSSGIGTNVLRRMNIDGKSGVAQSYLLGQLSRSAKAPKGLGKELVKIALSELSVAKSKVGCRMQRLDCHDVLVPYYEGLGFRYFRKNEAGMLNQMVTFIRFLARLHGRLSAGLRAPLVQHRAQHGVELGEVLGRLRDQVDHVRRITLHAGVSSNSMAPQQYNASSNWK